MTPAIDGKTHHFGHRGLYNGLSVLGDAETGSYWDHITGECLLGPMKGRSLDTAPLLHMTLEQAARRNDVLLAVSRPSVFARIMGRVAEWTRLSKRGFLPPGFRRTMGKTDPRLPDMEMGLGVWRGGFRRFYPLRVLREAGGAILDVFDGIGPVVVYIDSQSAIPAAVESPTSSVTIEGGLISVGGNPLNDGVMTQPGGAKTTLKRPMQLFTRWYGFAFTFPNCSIYHGDR